MLEPSCSSPGARRWPMPSAMGLLGERERVALARAEELRVELERPGAVVCWPLDRIPEVHHPLGGGEAVIPDALLYYQRHAADCTDGAGGADGGNEDGTDARGGVMLRAFVEVDRAPRDPNTSPPNCPPTHASTVTRRARTRGPAAATTFPEPVQETWRQRYPRFPRLLFILDSTGPALMEKPYQRPTRRHPKTRTRLIPARLPVSPSAPPP